MSSLYLVVAKKLDLPLGKVFKLKSRHGKEPYNAQYCFTNNDFVWRADPSWDWTSVITNGQQMRIFHALMRGDVEVVDTDILWGEKNNGN